jgi:hypothetical protein
MKPFSRERAEVALRDPKSKEAFEALRRLPPDVDAALVTLVVVDLFKTRVGLFARNCRVLPAEAIRGALKGSPNTQAQSAYFSKRPSRPISPTRSY